MKLGKRYLLGAKSPAEYIERCIKSSVSRGVKGKITHEWLQKTGYSIKDIIIARQNNGYWRHKRSQGSNERTRLRIHAHDYSIAKRTGWDESSIKTFLKLNKRLEDGSYSMPDFLLAQRFSTTLPAIQYMRRKFILAEKVVKMQPSYDMFTLMLYSEQHIKSILEE